jgi:hypothetical protein
MAKVRLHLDLTVEEADRAILDALLVHVRGFESKLRSVNEDEAVRRVERSGWVLERCFHDEPAGRPCEALERIELRDGKLVRPRER